MFDWDADLNRIKAKKVSEAMSGGNEEKPFDNLIHLNDSNFESVLNSSKLPLVIDFWASWCGPCQYMTPIFEQLAKKYEGKVVFGKVNIDESQEIPNRYGIYGVPTFIFFKEGKEINRVIGAVGANNLEAELKKLL